MAFFSQAERYVAWDGLECGMGLKGLRHRASLPPCSHSRRARPRALACAAVPACWLNQRDPTTQTPAIV